ncbi:hypothetical protein [uncultured Aquimarina sp.]|uniref:hypothetical protein n=1 Tax=uncultured Aquimarina sp. TaxID=575652 RepID=UPI0026373BB4|nr:hypothetical protein [uncultured Aquimarina sp.]
MKLKVISLIIIVVVVVSCNKSIESDLSLKTKLDEIILSNQTEINFDKIADFEWDQLLILPPYSITKKIEEKLSIDLSIVKNSKIESRDDINLLAFLKDGKAIIKVNYPRYPGDFTIDDYIITSRKNAIFTIKQFKELSSGTKYISLKLY